jgi:hypothetical protein
MFPSTPTPMLLKVWVAKVVTLRKNIPPFKLDYQVVNTILNILSSGMVQISLVHTIICWYVLILVID